MDDSSLVLKQEPLSNESLQSSEDILVNLKSLHEDLVLTNTLLAVFIGAFAAYCFFKFLFKG